MDQGCDTTGQGERGMRMLRQIIGVTLRNRERGMRMLRRIIDGCDTRTEKEE